MSVFGVLATVDGLPQREFNGRVFQPNEIVLTVSDQLGILARNQTKREKQSYQNERDYKIERYDDQKTLSYCLISSPHFFLKRFEHSPLREMGEHSARDALGNRQSKKSRPHGIYGHRLSSFGGHRRRYTHEDKEDHCTQSKNVTGVLIHSKNTVI